MKKKLNRFLFVIMLAPALVTGCSLVTKTPQVTAAPAGGTVTNLVYAPSPGINSVSNEVAALVPLIQAGVAATPAAPLAPFVPSAANGIFLAVAGIAGAYAAYKNKQAGQHADAAAALAAAVGNNTTLQQVAIAAAAQNGSVATVSQHIVNANSLT